MSEITRTADEIREYCKNRNAPLPENWSDDQVLNFAETLLAADELYCSTLGREDVKTSFSKFLTGG
jgi:hypothetical protein